MQQIAEPLHLGVDSFQNLLLVSDLGKALHKLLPVDELLDAKVAEVKEQIDLLWGQRDVEKAEGVFELQVGDYTLVISVCLLKGLLESLWAGAKYILHGFDNLSALCFYMVAVRVDVLHRTRHRPFNNIEILIDPVVPWVMLVQCLTSFGTFAVNYCNEPCRIETVIFSC